MSLDQTKTNHIPIISPKPIFIFLLFITQINSQYLYSRRELSPLLSRNELDCKETPIYKNLEISTNSNENSDDYSIAIMKDCKIEENWRVKEDIERQCLIPERVFEGEDNIRRSFRFTYHKNNAYKEKIVIKSITAEYPKEVAETSLTKESLTLSPGESVDLYVDYDCLDMDEKKRVSKNWFKLRIDVEFENKKIKSFEYVKICTASYADKLDLAHIVIIAFVFLIVFASVKDYLKSKIEGIIVERYTEIKNPENLLIISFVIGLILIFLAVVKMLHLWIYLAIFIVGPLSVAMIAEAIFRKNNILTHLETKSYEIPLIGSLTMFFLACLGCGLVVLFLWLKTHNWLINNIFSISISIITIRIFKFTSFKFIVSVYILSFVYEYLWVMYKSNYYGENYKLTNNAPENLPVNLLCPELLSSPFSACSSLPIADIILPGILLMYAKKFDESKYIQHYFYVGTASLGAGLILSLIVYYAKNLPTPSFFFTGPIILIATLIAAQKRSELYEFVEGFSSTIYENKADNNLNNYFEQQRRQGNQGSQGNQEYRPPPMMEMDEVEDDEDIRENRENRENRGRR